MAMGALALFSTSASASTFDNESGRYELSALPEAAEEAERMGRMELCDQHPAGRHVRKGEIIVITTAELPEGFYLDALVGFRPMWGSRQDQQVVPLGDGETRFVADQDGPLFFRFNPPQGEGMRPGKVTVRLRGGQPLPLYVDGHMSASAWRAELAAHAQAPFVQLVGEQAMITLPSAVHARDPVVDPRATFAAINEMLDLQDELAGLDGQTPRDQPSPLRQHYLVDFRVSAKDRESFYMYATDQFIGMLPDNTSDLTDPNALRERWGIWHETGHTHQQNSWTWEALAEVNVNLFSLYVQEAFDQPNQVLLREDGEPSPMDRARAYLAEGGHDLLAEVDDEDGSEFFIRLVMFHQLREVWGWDLFKDLHRHFRAHPLTDEATDQDKADAFVHAMCALTESDLRPFFENWGLGISEDADAAIDALGHEPPDADLFEMLDEV